MSTGLAWGVAVLYHTTVVSDRLWGLMVCRRWPPSAAGSLACLAASPSHPTLPSSCAHPASLHPPCRSYFIVGGLVFTSCSGELAQPWLFMRWWC